MPDGKGGVRYRMPLSLTFESEQGLENIHESRLGALISFSLNVPPSWPSIG